MIYYFRVIEMLSTLQEQFEIIALLLALEAGALALAGRRADAAWRVRLLLWVTVGWAIGAFALAGYAWWSIRALSPHIPFHRLPDGGIQFDRPLAVVVTEIGGAVLLIGAAVLLGSGALLLLSVLLNRARAAWRFQRSQRAARVDRELRNLHWRP